MKYPYCAVEPWQLGAGMGLGMCLDAQVALSAGAPSRLLSACMTVRACGHSPGGSDCR